MPIVGHAFVGWATAELAVPIGQADGRESVAVPAILAAAYLPDLLGQAGVVLGFAPARLYCHSLVVGAVIIPIFALFLAPILGGFKKSLWLIGLSVGLHDVLDILQSSDRLPLYPISTVPTRLPVHLPGGLLNETMIFGGAALAIATLRGRESLLARSAPIARLVFLSAFGLLAVGAVGTSRLRNNREAQADAAMIAIEHGEYSKALGLLDAAAAWPAPSKPGRIDYLRGEAYDGLNDRASAESCYLLSLQKDPTYMWALADLVLFYVSGNESLDVRRAKALPYLRRLRAHDEPYAGRVVAAARARLFLSLSWDSTEEP
jgi:tetratricopeptide (TPR) repeat protein